ncbi:MAG: DMT family transporter [Chlamydiales bacterium]|nr:DMT family transporter [Chlamydiales bacterium]
MSTIPLLIGVLLIWGLNWPLMKIAMADISPLWFGTFRMAIASVLLFIFLIVRGQLRVPTKQDRKHIGILGLLQMGAYILLVNLGLHYNSVGHSAILVYSTPIWIIPVVVLFFKEPFPFIRKIGFFLSVLGILALFNPLSFDWANQSAILGSGLLLLAALVWTVGALFTKYTKWPSSVIELLPWQLAIGTLFLMTASLIFEPQPVIAWSGSLAALLFYEGSIATAFVFWAIIEINKRLSAITSSLSMLAVPLIGMVSSAWYLGEAITAGSLVAYLLLTAGIICGIMSDRTLERTV